MFTVRSHTFRSSNIILAALRQRKMMTLDVAAMKSPSDDNGKRVGEASDHESENIKRQRETATTEEGPEATGQQVKNGEDTETANHVARQPKRRIAMLMAYCGTGYNGMQINPNVPTIEEELRLAFAQANVVAPYNAADLKKIKFQRTARTDKNVSAAGQVVSFKAVLVPDIVNAINSYLPPAIRVLGYQRVTGGFNCKMACTARQYNYVMPTFALSAQPANQDYRVDEPTLARLQEVLDKYRGTHNFHNYTAGKTAKDPSAMRHIHWFKVGPTRVANGLEFVTLSVKGQSFMLHQIRKMIGLSISITRGVTSLDKIAQSFQPHPMDVPKAPGLNLILEKVFFDGYNKKVQNMYGPLDWAESQEAVQAFEEEHIIPEIVQQELNTDSMAQWLENLSLHTFESRISAEQTTEKKIDHQTEQSLTQVDGELSRL